MCNFWNFRQWPIFMPQNGNFENQPVSRKPLSVERQEAQFRSAGLERDYMCNFWGFFQFSKLYELFSFSLTWDLMGAKIQNATPLVFIRSEPNFMINKVVMEE